MWDCSSKGVLSHEKVKELVFGLRPFGFKEIGLSKEWKKQHSALQRLSVAAHNSIAVGTDEMVVATLTHTGSRSEGGLPALICVLLRTELWNDHIHGAVESDARNLAAVVSAVKFHESLIASLIQLIQDLSYLNADCLSELCDYAYRKLASIQSHTFADDAVIDATIGQQQTGESTVKSEDLKLAALCVSILRHLTDVCDESFLSATAVLSLSGRLLDANDVVTCLIHFLCDNPFVRSDGTVFDVNSGEWRKRQGTKDGFVMDSVTAQLWLAVYNILCRPSLNSKWTADERHVNTALKLRPLLTPDLICEISMLRELRRYLEEVNLVSFDSSALRRYHEGGGVFATTDSGAVAHGVSAISEMRPEMVAAIKAQRECVVKLWVAKDGDYSDAQRMEDCKLLFGTYLDDTELIESLLDYSHSTATVDLTTLTLATNRPQTEHCEVCGKGADKRCARCKLVWYCSRKCQKRAWKKHKAMCKETCLTDAKQRRETEAGKQVTGHSKRVTRSSALAF